MTPKRPQVGEVFAIHFPEGWRAFQYCARTRLLNMVRVFRISTATTPDIEEACASGVAFVGFVHLGSMADQLVALGKADVPHDLRDIPKTRMMEAAPLAFKVIRWWIRDVDGTRRPPEESDGDISSLPFYGVCSTHGFLEGVRSGLDPVHKYTLVDDPDTYPAILPPPRDTP